MVAPAQAITLRVGFALLLKTRIHPGKTLFHNNFLDWAKQRRAIQRSAFPD